MHKGPIATIAIPVYNGQRFIAQAIESVLKQTRSDLILNIFDNCSTDKTAEIVNSFSDSRLRFFRNETNIGMLPNWQRALDSAQTPYCGVLFADDFYKEDFLQKTVAVMDGHPQVGIVSGGFEHYSEDQRLVFRGQRGRNGLISAGKYYQCLYEGRYIPPPSETLLRTQIVRQVGGYDVAGLNWIVDTDLYLRIAAAGYDAYFLKDIIACRRSWPGNSGGSLSTTSQCFADLYTILKRYDHPAYIAVSNRRRAYHSIWQFLRKVSWGLLEKQQKDDFERIFALFKSHDPRFQKWYGALLERRCRFILKLDLLRRRMKSGLKSAVRPLIKLLKHEGRR